MANKKRKVKKVRKLTKPKKGPGDWNEYGRPIKIRKKTEKIPKIPKKVIKKEPVEVDETIVWRPIEPEIEDEQPGYPEENLTTFLKSVRPNIKEEPFHVKPIKLESIKSEPTDESEPSAGPSSSIVFGK